ncbi:MAG: prepilin-type N-terminal cleavage/methylation domain-containing protein [Gemmatimonadaceae bacterium]|nr:prepilin-type N-terminal cleavage/methylation domain-containing protein [Gemmatimonadaceae bacterium]
MPHPLPHRRARGFTLVELLVAMTLGLIILGAATTFAINTARTQARSQVGDDSMRRSRYLALTLEQDIRDAGSLMPIRSDFGAVNLFNDTLAILRVPARDTVAGPSYFVTALGACGANCLSVRKRDGRVEITSGQVFLFTAVGDVNRLLLATAVTDPSPSNPATPVEITFLNTLDSLFHWPARLVGVSAANATVQALRLSAYYRGSVADTNALMVAERIGTDGRFLPEVLASGVSRWDVAAGFVNGTTASSISLTDTTQNHCALTHLTIEATLAPDQVVDRRMQSSPLTARPVRWLYGTRNLNVQRTLRRGRPCY